MDSHVRFSAILGFVLIFGIAFVFASMVIDSGTAGKAVSLALPQAQIRCPQGPPPQITGMYNLGPCKYELTNGIVVNDEASLNCSLGANLHYSGQDSSGFPAVTLIGTGKINGCKITGNFLTGIEIIPSPSGGGNAEVWDTTIDGPKTGILEKPGATGNLYQGNVITHTKIGMDLQGSGGKTKSSTIIQNGVGIRLGVPTYATFTGQTGEVCNTYFTQNFSWCSRPEQGKNHFIQSNLIQENSIGIETMGLETTVEENTINGNQQYGIKAQAIFLGDASIEGNPQFYSAIGAKIRQNIIRNNGDAGIFFPPWSTYYYKMPEKYWHYSEVIENTIEGTCAIPKLSISSGGTGIACAEGQVAGIQIGNDNSIYPGDVGEPILIQKNAMRKNEVGIQALRAQRPSIVENTISENSRNGIHIQSFSYLQYFLSNVIENNGENGVMLEKDSGANWSFYNQIIHNGKNGWLATNKPGGAFRTSCNDFSFNTKNGYYYYGQPTETWDVDPGRIWEFSHNRLIQNGGSGLILENKYVGSDPFDPFTQFTPTPGYQPLTRFFYNHLAQNGEKGISLDGWFGTGFMANNIIGNGMPSTDSGSNQVEDLWDEKAFAKAYNLRHCKVGNTCSMNADCGGAYTGGDSVCGINNKCQCAPGLTPQGDGTCGCYENQYYVGLGGAYLTPLSFPNPYTPYGNYWDGVGPTATVPPSVSPPLISCTSNADCMYGTCNAQTHQCGNYDTITATQPSTNYYLPSQMLDCPIITYNPNTPIFVDPDDPDDPLGPDITVDPPIIHPIGPFETETTAPGVSELLNE